MPSYIPAKKNTEYIFYISLVSQADTKLLQANPTLAAGDVKVSTDGGAEGNIAALPVVTPAGSKRVKITLSASEMNGDNIQLTFSDAADAEWCDITVNIPTTTTQIDNLVRATTPANTLNVDGSGLVNITQAAADKVWSTTTRTLSSFGTLVSDIWSSGTRTLTAFSTGLAVSIWDVLETAIVTASSIGLKVKNNLDATITSRSSHGDPDPSGYIDASIAKGIKDIISVGESQRGGHTHQAMGNIFYVDPVNGDTHANGNRGGINDPYSLVQDCHDNAITDSNHDLILLLAGASGSNTTLTEDVILTKRYMFIRGPGRDFIWTRSGNGDTITISADGIELSGFQLNTDVTGVGNGVQIIDADFHYIHHVWINNTRGDGINVLRGQNVKIEDNIFTDTGQSGAGQGIDMVGTAGSSDNNLIRGNTFRDCAGDAIKISGGTTNNTIIDNNHIEGSAGFGINIGASSTDAFVTNNKLGNNSSGNINDNGTTTVLINNYDTWDELLTGATHNINNSAGKRLRQMSIGSYEHGSVWIDTVNGTAGAVDYENGTVDNPVDNIADATTLAVSLGLKRFTIAPGSSLILAQAYTNYTFDGHGWVLALGGQDISDSIIMGAVLSGTSVGTETHYVDCDFGIVLLSSAHAHRCAFVGPITLSSSGDYFFVNCYSAVAGIGAPVFDFDAIAGSTNVNLRHYSGGVDVRNMGQVGTDNMSLEGDGQLIMNANCIGGTVAIRGNFTLTNNGLSTISDAARFDSVELVDDIDAELTSNHGAGSWGAGGTVVLPVMQGEVYSAVAVQSKEVTIVKGDSPRIIFDLESDYTGWTIWFGAKEKMSDTSYAITVREVTWSDASLGQGYIDLSVADTDLIGKIFAELELRQGAQRFTAMKYTLVIIDDVIDA